MILEFLDLKSGPSLCVCVGFLFSQPQTYIKLILRAITYKYRDQEIYFLCMKLLRLYAGFVTKCFQIFIVDEVKNFAANNICSSCQSQSHTKIRAKGQSQIGGLCIKGNKTTTRSSLTGYWSKGSTVDRYFGIGQGSW